MPQQRALQPSRAAHKEPLKHLDKCWRQSSEYSILWCALLQRPMPMPDPEAHSKCQGATQPSSGLQGAQPMPSTLNIDDASGRFPGQPARANPDPALVGLYDVPGHPAHTATHGKSGCQPTSGGPCSCACAAPGCAAPGCWARAPGCPGGLPCPCWAACCWAGAQQGCGWAPPGPRRMHRLLQGSAPRLLRLNGLWAGSCTWLALHPAEPRTPAGSRAARGQRP